jgi:hypothetical protein
MLEYRRGRKWFRFMRTGQDVGLSDENIIAMYPAFDWRIVA